MANDKSIKTLLIKHWRGLICISISLLFLLITLMPFLRLALYSVPYYDDYNFGLYTRNALELLDGETGGKSSFFSKLYTVILSMFNCGYTEWKSWQGAYSCSAFSSLTPHAFGENYYYIGPIFIILFFAFSIIFFSYNLFRYVFKSDIFSGLTLSLIISATVINLFHVPGEGFYWFNAAVAYVGMFSFECILLGFLISFIFKNKLIIPKSIVLMILAFIVAGANYVTALQTAILLIVILILYFFLGVKNKSNNENLNNKRNSLIKLIILIVTIIIYFTGFAISFLSPGNANREAAVGVSSSNPLLAVIKSFEYAFLYSKNYYGLLMLVVMLIAIIPVVSKLARSSKFEFKYPLIILLASFCLYASSFTPGLYALENPGAGRTVNIIKITFIILLMLNFIYFEGALIRYIDKKLKKNNESNSVFKKLKAFIEYMDKCKNCQRILVQIYKLAFHFVLILLLMILVFKTTENRVVAYPSFGAYYYIKSGIANNFHNEYKQRLVILKSDEKDIILDEYNYAPAFLLINDLSENENAEINRFVARWYDKHFIKVIKKI